MPTRWHWRRSVPTRRSRHLASPGRSPRARPVPRHDCRSSGPPAVAATAPPDALSPRGRGRTGRTTRRGRRPRSAPGCRRGRPIRRRPAPRPSRASLPPRVSLEGQGHIQLVRSDEHAGGATEQHRADRLPARNAAGQRDQLAERDAEIDLVDARPRHVPRDAEELGPAGPRGPDAGIGRAALHEDRRDVHEGLDVVDHRRLAEQAGLNREGRLVARLAALPLDRVEQGRLFAADIGACAATKLHVEREARVLGRSYRAGRRRGPRRSPWPSVGSRADTPRARRDIRARSRSRSPRCVIPSRTANGSPSIRTRSLKVPGSDSSALQTT